MQSNTVISDRLSPQNYGLFFNKKNQWATIMRKIREKVLDTTVRITILRHTQTGWRRRWLTLWTRMTGRLVIDASAPLSDIVQCIFRNSSGNPANAYYAVLPYGFYTRLILSLPKGNHSKEIRIRQGEFNRGLKVLARTRQGKVLSALWLIRLTPTSARLVLYLK